MIKIDNLSLKINGIQILNNLCLKLPHYGLISICGPSGCGKTSLLNCLSGLLNYSGCIEIDGINVNRLSEKQMDEFRLKNIGFIFQDFKLFNSEDVINNIKFPLDTVSNDSRERKMRKVFDLMELVGIKRNKHQSISSLSGGEKQRVAIARALVNDPKIILADEPTGSLDSKNSEEVLKLLSKISKNSLVILVSHDRDLVNKYSDVIVDMLDGQIKSVNYYQKRESESFLPLCKNKLSNKRSRIGIGFLIRHARQSLRTRKWRTLFCNAVTSLGLIGIGIAISLSSAISSNIKSAYSSLIDENKIVASIRQKDQSVIREAASFEEIKSLSKIMDNDEMGICYINDFEQMFKDGDSFSIEIGSYWTNVDGFSSRSINEFKILNRENVNVYPSYFEYLNNDEIVLGINYPIIERICFCLKIPRTIESLTNYLKENSFDISFDFKNDDWRYWDKIILKVKGFILQSKLEIYHTNNLWNEFIFENTLRFPFTYEIDAKDKSPWTFRKSYYFYAKEMDDFIKENSTKVELNKYLFEIPNESIYPWLYRDIEPKDRKRVIIFKNNNEIIPYSYGQTIEQLDNDLDGFIYGTNSGYSIFPEYLMMGFSHNAYFSITESLIDDVIDELSFDTYESQKQYSFPKSLFTGHYTKSSQNGVIFESFTEKLIVGTTPVTYDEIAISSEFYRQLFGTKKFENDILKCGFTLDEKLYSNGLIVREIKKMKLKITGIYKSSKKSISHNEFWTIGFFQSRLGISIFNLTADSIAFNLKSSKRSTKVLDRLAKAFPTLNFVNPMTQINKSVDEVCFYIQIALMVFSSVALLISIILIYLNNYLYISENARDVGLTRCIGLSKNESSKFVYSHSFVSCLSSFSMASFELLIISFITQYEMSSIFNNKSTFDFNPLSIIVMLVISIIISLISCISISLKMKKYNPIELLKK